MNEEKFTRALEICIGVILFIAAVVCFISVLSALVTH